MAQTVLKKSKYWSLDSDIWVLKFNRYNFFYKSIHFKPSYQLGFWFPIFCLNASAKIWSSRGAFHHPPLMRNFPTSYLNPIYLAKVCYWFVPGDVGDMRRVRPHGKNFDLKFVIITILRRNNDNNDNNDDNKISGSNTNNNNNKNNNPSRWYVHKFWYTTNERGRHLNTRYNKHSECWSRKSASFRWRRKVSNVDAIKNETLSATGQKTRTKWSTTLEMN